MIQPVQPSFGQLNVTHWHHSITRDDNRPLHSRLLVRLTGDDVIKDKSGQPLVTSMMVEATPKSPPLGVSLANNRWERVPLNALPKGAVNQVMSKLTAGNYKVPLLSRVGHFLKNFLTYSPHNQGVSHIHMVNNPTQAVNGIIRHFNEVNEQAMLQKPHHSQPAAGQQLSLSF
ncbi:MAG: hypothetical protein KC476_07880 [Cyanobacteria bacterium HKST-UBA06]|nr:hypothetical protein [Cyanobacteria bacterium HKST-UBA04]MCA9807858.1 hypothetical protein [Cyanobacteria bacterium HKST-UBA06]MCA9841915.1 hypothetical protein [Cyanobacteria bacterium HKST-UBA03]